MVNNWGIICLMPLIIQSFAKIPTITFNNGEKIPILGLGTFRSKPEEVNQAVKDALDIGYRHIDCAYSYRNQKEVGQAISEKLSQGVVKREDLFITSKLPNNLHDPEQVEVGLKTILKDLNLQYLDLYLIHWPMGVKEDGVGFSNVDYVDTWLAMENIHKKGLAKSIGISNFNKRQVERLLEVATIIPVTNQVECHPYLNQQKLIDFCKSKNITITAYSPLGSPNVPNVKPKVPKLMDHPKIQELSRKLQKTPAQILLRYQIQRGVIVIPKSVHKNRIAENFNVFDFELSADEMSAINDLDVHGRVTTISPFISHKYYPFSDEY